MGTFGNINNFMKQIEDRRKDPKRGFYEGGDYLGTRETGGPEAGAAWLRQILGATMEPGAERAAGLAEEGQERYREAWENIGVGAEERASTATTAFAEDLFRAGGPIQEALFQATGRSARAGFGPSESGQLAAEQARVQTGATRDVGNFFTQQYLQGVQQDIGMAGMAQQGALANEQFLQDYLISLFTGAGSVENLAYQQWALKKQT